MSQNGPWGMGGEQPGCYPTLLYAAEADLCWFGESASDAPPAGVVWGSCSTQRLTEAQMRGGIAPLIETGRTLVRSRGTSRYVYLEADLQSLGTETLRRLARRLESLADEVEQRKVLC